MNPSVETASLGRATPVPGTVLLLLFFFSGFSALVYQVLWAKQLALLFGSTAQAAAATLAVFFLGLAAGGYVWSRGAVGLRRPLRAYAKVEFGIALAALLYFVLVPTYHAFASALFGAVIGSSWGILLKLLLAVTLLFPASFFMGGTIPLMGEAFVGAASRLGRQGTLLYAVNTAGAACGALAAGFYLPPLLGYNRSLLLAMSINMVIGTVSWWLSRQEAESIVAPSTGAPSQGLGWLSLLAFTSGLLTLALEVVWTHMLAQVFQNSVYSFAAILVTFLVALAAGSALANLLSRISTAGASALGWLLLLCGATVAISPVVFFEYTDAMSYLGASQRWSDYRITLFQTAGAVILPPGILIGAVFPFLFRLAGGLDQSAGSILGRLVAVNTLGAIAGSLIGGFLMLNSLGLSKSVQVLAALYLLAAALVFDRGSEKIRWMPVAVLALLGLQLGVFYLGYSNLPVTRARRGETIVQEWAGVHGSVAVVEQEKVLAMRLNNHYTLGNTASLSIEETQADLPLLLHPKPQSVFFLGLGTGVSAGAALDFPIRELVATELVPEVIEAARTHFHRYTGSLFVDGRVQILAEDGRHYLQSSRRGFDVIIGDLFLPWGAGAGNLYSLEHFQSVRQRLKPEGIFAQWLPLHQLSEQEFGIIARTMLEVFPQVTLWRGSFAVTRPIAALVGQEEGAVLDPDALTRVARARSPQESSSAGVVAPFLLYSGNLSAASELFAEASVNYDDRPKFQYLAPITHKSSTRDQPLWLPGERLLQFSQRLRDLAQPATDPYLARLNPQQKEYVEAGFYYMKSLIFRRARNRLKAREAMEEFRRRVPAEVAGPESVTRDDPAEEGLP